jgi:hypothetical protein
MGPNQLSRRTNIMLPQVEGIPSGENQLYLVLFVTNGGGV